MTRALSLETALEVASELDTVLRNAGAPRVSVAGSVRRARPLVHDIELLVEPPAAPDLFGVDTADTEGVRRVLEERGRLVKAGDRYIRVRMRLEEIPVDVFLCHPPAEWGVLLAIRTGPWMLGKAAVIQLRRRGYVCEGGHVVTMRDRETVPCPTEERFFELAGLPCLPPHERDSDRALVPLQRSAFEALGR